MLDAVQNEREQTFTSLLSIRQVVINFTSSSIILTTVAVFFNRPRVSDGVIPYFL